MTSCSHKFEIKDSFKKEYIIGDTIKVKVDKSKKYQIIFEHKNIRSDFLLYTFNNLNTFDFKLLILDENKIILQKEYSIKPKDTVLEYYLPEKSEWIINKKDFYHFKYNTKEYKISKDDYEGCKINSVVFIDESECPVYGYGYFINKIEKYDIFFKDNFYKFIKDDKKQKIYVNFVTKDDIDFDYNMSSFFDKDYKLVVHEVNPLFTDYIFSVTKLNLPEIHINSYFFILYDFEYIKETPTGINLLNNQYILVLNIHNFDELKKIKNYLIIDYKKIMINNLEGYVNDDGNLYFLFKEDKIIIVNYLNILDILSKINKIPFSRYENEENLGFFIVKNTNNIKSLFDILNFGDLKGESEIYFKNFKK